jgi:hypothetical protein
MAKPQRIASSGAVIPLILGALGILLAKNAAPAVPFSENPLCLFNLLTMVFAVGMLLVPRIFGWGWESKYFGASLFNLGSLTLIFFTPYLCLIIYSQLSLPIKAVMLLSGIAAHIIWCRRFIIFYKEIDASKFIYQEDGDAVYYMQRKDKNLIEKKFKFNQIPKGRYFLVFIFISLALTPFMATIRMATGIPFIHVFFSVGTIPISLMAAGLSTRAWLIFYYYPGKIQAATGKLVYVDMSEGNAFYSDLQSS